MKINKERQALIGAYKRCFAGEDGQVVLNHLKKLANVTRAHFVPGAVIDERDLIYKEARRALVLGIISAVERDDADDPEQELALIEGDLSDG